MGRKAGLSKDDVVQAAAEIADHSGLDALTLAAVAARLGVRSPSLYSHVDGVAGLERELALRVARELATALEAAADGRRGLDALRPVAAAYRRFAHEHPGRYAAAQRAVRPGEDDELYGALARAVAPVVRALEEAGVEPADRIHLARAIRSALHGYVMLESAGGFGMPESVDESFRRLVELLVAGVASEKGRGRGPKNVDIEP